MELTLLNKATEFAFEAHKGQIRKGTGIPYFCHLSDVTGRVAHYLNDHGINRFSSTKDEILSAAMLHDYVEDCNGTKEILEKEFGKNVARIVLDCTRESSKNTRLDKLEFLESFRFKELDSNFIKLADRYCNVMDYYRTSEKRKYASFYALQAYPVYMKVKRSTGSRVILSDIEEMKTIVSRVYNIDATAIHHRSEVIDIITQYGRKHGQT